MRRVARKTYYFAAESIERGPIGRMLQNQIRLKCKMHQGSGALLISARGPAKFNRWRIWSTRAPTVHGVKSAGGIRSCQVLLCQSAANIWRSQGMRNRFLPGCGTTAALFMPVRMRPRRKSMSWRHQRFSTPQLALDSVTAGSRKATSSPGKSRPLIETMMYCCPFNMYVIGEPLCGAGM